MRRIVLIATLSAIGLLALFWLLGGPGWLSAQAAHWQREFQNGMARALRALQAGEPDAVWSLLTVCFGYGFFHAAGPGHGKVLIGGYGLASRASLRRLAGLSLAASLAQGATAVLLVGAGVVLFNLSRQGMTDLAEDLFAPLSYGAIILIGLWLVWRGLRHLRGAHGHQHHHHHAHHGDGPCPSCGHSHGPTLEEAAQVTTWREGAALIGAIAIRPCTGALFLLVLTWRFGIFGLGIAGTFAMALGTAAVTVLVACAAAGLRDGAFFSLADHPRARLVAPALELAAGLIVTALAAQLLLVSLR